MKTILVLLLLSLIYACKLQVKESDEGLVKSDSIPNDTVEAVVKDTTKPVAALAFNGTKLIDTKAVTPQQVIDFAQTWIGAPYQYASSDPAVGFDCSGFITYVFNHFGIAVPRSSVDFTHVGTEVLQTAARPGDLILFTGTDSTVRTVGHMGIVVSNTDSLRFIHASSGKANGVVITPLNRYYQGRYVKTVRIFPEGVK